MHAPSEQNNVETAGRVATVHCGYLENRVRFEEFYALQRKYTETLSAYPAVVNAWLSSLPQRGDPDTEASGASNSWRAARLSSARRRTLAGLIAGAERSVLARDSLSAVAFDRTIAGSKPIAEK